MTFDLEQTRADTPGCTNLIHLNNCGMALTPQPVLDALFAHLQAEQDLGGYEAAARHADKVEAFYTHIAALLNCAPQEVAYLENATRAWQSIFHALDFSEGDRILTARSEYASNYISYLRLAEETGVSIEPVPDDEHGQLDVGALDEMIDERVKLISVTHIPTNSGLVNPVEEIGVIARKHNIFYLVDACQAAGQVRLDVEKIGCDALTATGRKYMRGPRGTGFLYVRQSRLVDLIPPVLDLHSATWTGPDRYEIRADARRFEVWESHVAGKVSLGVAAEYAGHIGMDVIETRVAMLADHFRNELAGIDRARVLDGGIKKGGIVSFILDGIDPMTVKQTLAEQRINLTTTGVTSTRLNMEDKGIDLANRAGIHYYNSEGELEKTLEALRALSKD